jgi:hypothetical protein
MSGLCPRTSGHSRKKIGAQSLFYPQGYPHPRVAIDRVYCTTSLFYRVIRASWFAQTTPLVENIFV